MRAARLGRVPKIHSARQRSRSARRTVMKKVCVAWLGGIMLGVAVGGFTAPAKADSQGFGPFGFGYSDNDGYNVDWRWRRHHPADRRAYYNDDWRYGRHHRNYY